MRWMRLVGAGLLVAGLLGVGAPGVAVACACGGIVSPDVGAQIADEEALVALAGDRETIVMRLNLSSTADNAALIVPTPSPASVSSADRSVFASLAELSAPRVETRRHFTFGEGMIAEGASRAAAPTVVAQVQLGPLEATTLTGGNVSSVTQWLDAHGYTMRREVVAQLDPYLDQGWAFVAMRLTSSERLDGQLARSRWSSPPTAWCTRCGCRRPRKARSRWWSTRWDSTGCSGSMPTRPNRT